ncbi:MAG: hypothetical protein GX640_23470 [Fibrobacter sp.]|nr:hypothetical protein [Fibrobacter sp.]
MSEKQNNSYFDDALKIHAICADNSLSENEARLLTYMHAKAIESGKGVEYFYSPAQEDTDALLIMLGQNKTKIQLPSVASLDQQGQDALELILTIASRISYIDNLLAKECGLENRLSGELRSRLRLYQDSSFRDSMIEIYKKVIQPKLESYTRQKIDDAFCRFRTEQQKKEKELMNFVGI